MNKLFIGGLAALALTLSGCTSPSTPTVTVTETVTAQPSQGTNNSSNASLESEFITLMKAVGTPSYLLEGEALDILISQARDVCGYISDGDSVEDIVWIITLASAESGASDTVIDAFLAASVAGTYTYCPQYEGFFE
jgi:hypothetical protein